MKIQYDVSLIGNDARVVHAFHLKSKHLTNDQLCRAIDKGVITDNAINRIAMDDDGVTVFYDWLSLYKAVHPSRSKAEFDKLILIVKNALIHEFLCNVTYSTALVVYAPLDDIEVGYVTIGLGVEEGRYHNCIHCTDSVVNITCGIKSKTIMECTIPHFSGRKLLIFKQDKPIYSIGFNDGGVLALNTIGDQSGKPITITPPNNESALTKLVNTIKTKIKGWLK